MRDSRARSTGDVSRAILAAPLDLPTSRWSSRSLAETYGVSQSVVSRAWAPMRTTTRVTQELHVLARGRPVTLVGMLVRETYTLIVFEVVDDSVGVVPRFVSRAIQRSLRAVLGAEFVRERIVDSSSASETVFWESLRGTWGSGRALVALASGPAPVPTEIETSVQCTGDTEWLSQMSFFCAARHLRPDSAHSAEAALREWVRAPTVDFVWVADPVRVNEVSGSCGGWSPPGHRGPTRSLADDIVAEMRSAISDGRLAGGDRVTERYLATRLRTTRTQVRSAIQLLERDGLVTVSSGHAAVIPIPAASDVIETYIARQALGSMITRAAVRWSPPSRASVQVALEEVRARANSRDVRGTGEADMAFQDQIADASGLVRVTPMFRTLGQHLRMFIAVMDLDYAYSAQAILRDNDAIFVALESGNADHAAELWRQKMDDARGYMLETLASVQRYPNRYR